MAGGNPIRGSASLGSTIGGVGAKATEVRGPSTSFSSAASISVAVRTDDGR